MHATTRLASALALLVVLLPPLPPRARAETPRPPGVLAGTVTDPAGRPVRGAVVEAMRGNSLGRFEPFLRTETDAGGRYRIADIPLAVLRCWVRASSPGLVPARVAADVGSGVPRRLPGGARIRGVVATTEGKPVAGARVTAAPSSGPVLPKEIPVPLNSFSMRTGGNVAPTCGTVTDAKGEFLLDQAIPGANELSVAAPGFAAWVEVVDAPGTEETVVAPRLSPAGKTSAILGKVASGGRPVPGARVTTFDGGRSAVTDAEGRYRLEDCDALRSVRVVAPGFAGGLAPQPGFTEHRGDGTDYVQDFDLAPAAPVRGVVLDAAGAPVAAARVGWELAALVQGAEEGVARTGADGAFVLAEPPPGAAEEVLAVVEDGSFGKTPVVRDGEGASPPLSITLFAPCIVRGRVLDSGERPDTGVQVQSPRDLAVVGGDREGQAPAAGTDKTGAYVLRLPPSTEYGLRIVEPGRWPPLGWSSPFEAPAGGEIAMDLRAGPAGPIEGVVVDGEGRPLPGVEVRAYPENWRGGRPMWIDAKTDEAGRFSIAEAQQEPHRVQAVRWGEGSSDLGSDPVPGVHPGRKGLRLVLPPPGSVAGTVLGVEKDSFRRIAIYLCPGGEKYEGSPFGTLGGTIPVPCRLEGDRLLPEEPGEGVRPKRVRAWRESGKEPAAEPGPLDQTPYSWRVSDDQVEVAGDGTFRLAEIRWGRWRLEVDDIDAEPATLEFAVEPGEEAKPVLRIRRRGRLAARVRGEDGGPLQGATVVVLDGKGAPLPVLVETVVLSSFGGMHSGATLRALFEEIVRTGAEGTTEARHLDAGEYAVRILKEAYRPFEARVRIPEGEEAPLEAVLEKSR